MSRSPCRPRLRLRHVPESTFSEAQPNRTSFVHKRPHLCDASIAFTFRIDAVTERLPIESCNNGAQRCSLRDIKEIGACTNSISKQGPMVPQVGVQFTERFRSSA